MLLIELLDALAGQEPFDRRVEHDQSNRAPLAAPILGDKLLPHGFDVAELTQRRFACFVRTKTLPLERVGLLEEVERKDLLDCLRTRGLRDRNGRRGAASARAKLVVAVRLCFSNEMVERRA